jgi:sugar lactone lactonase YvrE
MSKIKNDWIVPLAVGLHCTNRSAFCGLMLVISLGQAVSGQTIPVLGGDVEELWVSDRGNDWLEGPAYDGVGGLWFAAGGQVFGADPTSMLRYDLATGATETVLGFDVDPHAAGLAFDDQGRLIATHVGPASQGFLGGLGVTRRSVDQPDQYEVLAPSSFEGTPIAPNDLVLDSEGGIYFTHLAFPPTPGADAVFYIRPDGDWQKAATGPLTSNGIGMSPDGETLYVLSQFGLNITAFDINEDHTLSNERVLIELTNFGDGMTVDRFGNLYVSDLGASEVPPGGITGIPDSMVRVFNPAGEEILAFEPPHGAINMTFGAPEDTLYIAGWNVLQRVPITFIPEPTTVSIDIKPGSDPNSINLGANGSVPVAIFGTNDFDVTTVDPMTVTLANSGVRLRGKGTPMTSLDDLNMDGFTDLVLHVETQGFELTGTDIEAWLTGETFDGIAFSGMDSIRIVPPSNTQGIPEPSTFILAALGLLGLVGYTCRQQKHVA